MENEEMTELMTAKIIFRNRIYTFPSPTNLSYTFMTVRTGRRGWKPSDSAAKWGCLYFGVWDVEYDRQQLS